MLRYYQKPRPQKELPIQIASFSELSQHLIESELLFEKPEYSHILDDQEKTQVPSQTLIELVSERQAQCAHLLSALPPDLVPAHHAQLALVARLYDKIWRTLNQLATSESKLPQDASVQKQQRFFSQHNSEKETEHSNTKQLKYNPEVLNNMLKRLRQAKNDHKLVANRSLFRSNQRILPGQATKMSLQHIPLLESKSPLIRTLCSGTNLKTCARENCSTEQQIQKTELNEQVSQGTLSFLKQLKKTKSIEIKKKKHQTSQEKQPKDYLLLTKRLVKPK